jgi:beta-lactamase regulating signal transducer with metallopeptidase domain
MRQNARRTGAMTETLAYVAGWTLVHSLWQGAIIAVVAAGLLAVIPRASSRLRYAVLCCALFAHLAAPVATAVVLTPRALALTKSAGLSTAGSAPRARPEGLTGGTPTFRETDERAAAPRARTLTPVITQAVAAAGQLERFLPFAVVLWLVGVAVGAVRRVGGWLLVRRLVSRATPASAALAARVNELGRVLGIRRAVRVLVSTDVTGPFTTGWLRPAIVMPLSMLSGLDPVHVDAILTHELAHIHRWDYVVAIIQSIALTVLFHHPVTWWLDRRLRIEREYCCDDVAVAASRDRVGYVRALAELESLRLGLPSLALAATDGSLQHRVVRLLSGRPPAAPGSWAPAVALLSLILAAGALNAASVPSAADSVRAPNDGAVVPAVAQSGAQQGSVIRHPDPSAPLETRWTWALDQARRRGTGDEVVIGWMVRSAVNDSNVVISSTDGTSQSRGPKVAEILGLPTAERGVAILLTWSGGEKGELTAVRLRGLQTSLSLADRPLVWLHSATDAPSIALIHQLMASQTDASARSELGAALTLHDDRDQVLRAVTRVFETERDPRVRSEAIAWLGNRGGDSAVVALLRRAIDDPAPEVRDEALTALGAARHQRTRAILLELLRSSNRADIRSEVVQQLSDGGDDVVAVLLRVAFDDVESDVRAEAVDAIKETSGAAATAALRDIAQRHPERRLRSEARDALDERGFR